MIVEFLNTISFAQPYFLWLLLIIPILIVWQIKRSSKNLGSLSFAAPPGSRWPKSLKIILRPILFILRLLAIICLIIVLARPQTKFTVQEKEGEGIDIVLCIDVSGSMTAQDFTPNRLEAAKRVAIDFVDHRPSDRIGVVIFAGESFTQCPLTTDAAVVKSQIQQIRNGFLEDGTSIGSGLSTSVDRLRNSRSKSKVVILLTDGVNNGGLIDPSTAKEIAKAFGIKVYTVGVGTNGFAKVPINTPLGIVMQEEKVNIDETMLNSIATETGGKYFRATDNESLEKIYADISQMEKSKVTITTYQHYTEMYYPILLAAIVFLFAEILLRMSVLKKFP